eukprot:354448-Chlamydomonas_euryale.AAC.9
MSLKPTRSPTLPPVSRWVRPPTLDMRRQRPARHRRGFLIQHDSRGPARGALHTPPRRRRARGAADIADPLQRHLDGGCGRPGRLVPAAVPQSLRGVRLIHELPGAVAACAPPQRRRGACREAVQIRRRRACGTVRGMDLPGSFITCVSRRASRRASRCASRCAVARTTSSGLGALLGIAGRQR